MWVVTSLCSLKEVESLEIYHLVSIPIECLQPTLARWLEFIDMGLVPRPSSRTVDPLPQIRPGKTYHVTIVVNLPQVSVLDLAPTILNMPT